MPPLINSRYWQAKGKLNDDTESTLFLEERTQPDYDKILTGEEHIHTVKRGETLAQLAGIYFEGVVDEDGNDISDHLWWILAEINEIMDLTLDMDEGLELTIPSPRTVQEKVLNR